MKTALFLLLLASISVARADVSIVITANGTSMVPTLGDGLTTVRIEPIAYEALRPGMVVRYFNKMRFAYVVHRIAYKNLFGGWVTKGDNCQRPDRGIVTRETLQGRVRWVRDVSGSRSLAADRPELLDNFPAQ